MKLRGASLGILVATIALASLAPVGLSGQARSVAKSAWTPPRTPDGRPDLQGVWNFSTATPVERPEGWGEFLTPAQVAQLEQQRKNDDEEYDKDKKGSTGTYNTFWIDRGSAVVGTKRSSLIIDPPDGRFPPLTPEAKERTAADRRREQKPGSQRDTVEDLNLGERCILAFNAPPMFPRLYNNNVQLLQTPGYVAVYHEMVHDVRVVPLDNRPHIGPRIQEWLGDSVGRWEGDTLIVETRNFRKEFTSRGFNAKPSEALHLVERFTRVGPDELRYQFTVTDPATWTKSWTAELPMNRTQDLIYEYACHEGNYSMTNALSGSRTAEKAADAAKTKKGSH